MVGELCPDLDLSSIIPPGSEDGVAEEEVALNQEEASIEPKIIQVDDATVEQRNDDEA